MKKETVYNDKEMSLKIQEIKNSFVSQSTNSSK